MKTSKSTSIRCGRERVVLALLLLVILSAATLSSVPHVAAITQYELLDHTMCKNVTSRGQCIGETHAFDATDPVAYLWFEIEMGESGTWTATIEWYYQSGSVEKSGSWPEYDVKKGETWWFGFALDIRDAQRGFWRVEVHIEGEHAFTEEFTIGPYYEVRVDLAGIPDTVNVPIKVDGLAYGEMKGGESKRLGFAPETSHTLSVVEAFEVGPGVRWIVEEGSWGFSREGAHTFKYEEQYQLTIQIEPDGAVVVEGAGWYSKGATVRISQIPEIIEVGTGTRLARKAALLDNSEVSTPPTSIMMDKPHVIGGQYQKQYLLKVTSAYGTPQGEGWYEEHSSATFSVTSPSPVEGFMGTLGGKHVFDHWSGDSAATTTTASVTMDRPKTVNAEWLTDNTMPYAIFGGITAAVVLIVAALLMRRRVPTPVPSAPPPPPAPPTAAPAAKFCIDCGDSLLKDSHKAVIVEFFLLTR